MINAEQTQTKDEQHRSSKSSDMEEHFNSTAQYVITEQATKMAKANMKKKYGDLYIEKQVA